MNTQDLRNQSAVDLAEHVLELRKEQFNLRMQRSTGEFKQTHQLKRVRRDIARTKTVQGEKK
ncbi:50S ribosomal protein L29 [Metallibacterium sp.]|jgi:large subunit ribosomal protein L29|uniref:50S ribosomal protein L29 n=1 Tax=Metallibacterium sp. TaxID=2940281 RepID=UPI0026194268|nr:50S ribosomal protein L29 [Metallibacterium sp.]